jgi:hypothetical protein
MMLMPDQSAQYYRKSRNGISQQKGVRGHIAGNHVPPQFGANSLE